MSKTDITAVVNGHREGLLLKPALDSVRACFESTREKNLKAELLVAMDRSDELTMEVVSNGIAGMENARIVPMDNGDVGRCRNQAALMAEGEYVAFLDGDDLWSPNWLADALSMVRSDPRELVLHPEVNVYFGHDPHVFVHVDAESNDFDIGALALVNYWTSLCFVRREFLVQHPYPETNLAAQMGYEDWGWNLKVISGGAIHKCVPGTGHAIRMKQVSLVRQTTSAGCIAAPSDIFRTALKNRPRSQNSKLRIAP
ncbi:glycosyltransferase family 2 protein [Variovorax boronicumulans]|uniref:glycosyltransferase family 2 protein n=1 Tax=Variovorax boronicumulans TaxID=436515 RepID=UPI00278A14E4|nr:glycosyltransferase family A protein [Variovorax boronicumulans]MDQ0042404.1 glycosyltransferase involved in cell wall biosynthesis [Variovorax boronicumulans]